MTSKRILGLVLAAIIGTGCSLPSPRAGNGPAQGAGALQDLLKAHRGRILVLLLGREDCPGTMKSTAILDEYVSRKPREVDVVRLDTPLPGETPPPVSEWKHPFPRATDENRRIADELGFFYYPTLYLFDRKGEKRFEGGCDASQIDAMVKEILAERPGSAKRSFTVPMIRPGEAAPAFSAVTLEGKPATLDTLRGTSATLLFFSKTTCPFTIQALPQLGRLTRDFQGRGVGVAIVDVGGTPEIVRPVYEKSAPGFPAVLDQEGAVAKAYGIDAVPSFVLLNGENLVAATRSFTFEAAENALNVLFDLDQAKRRYPSGAG